MMWRAPPMRAPWMIDSPTPPQPNTATVWPGLEPGAAQRRADPGEHAAADERRLVEREVVVDLHERVLVQQHALGVAADAEELARRAGRSATGAASPLRRASRCRRRRDWGGRRGTARSCRRSPTGRRRRGRRRARRSRRRRPPRRCRRPRARARCRRSSGEPRRRRRRHAGRCGRRRSRRCAPAPRGRAAGRCRSLRCSAAHASRGRRQP